MLRSQPISSGSPDMLELSRKARESLTKGTTILQASRRQLIGACDLIIENHLYYRRDVTLGEDGSQSRTGKVSQMPATLNNVVLAPTEMLAVSNVAAQMRELATFPEQALQLLLSGSKH